MIDDKEEQADILAQQDLSERHTPSAAKARIASSISGTERGMALALRRA